MKTTRFVLTIGTFDIPHAGHARFLRECARFGRLMVGVNSDDFVLTYKGALPVFSEVERMNLIRGMGYDVFLNDGPGADLIRRLQPDVLAVGSDWINRDYLRQIGVTSLDCALVFLPYTDGISTTEIRNRLLSKAR